MMYYQPHGLRKQVRRYEDTPSAFAVLARHFKLERVLSSPGEATGAKSGTMLP